MSQPTYPAPAPTQEKNRQARAARRRLPVVWIVIPAAIALMIVVGVVISIAR
jgi:hypothetical protein